MSRPADLFAAMEDDVRQCRDALFKALRGAPVRSLSARGRFQSARQFPQGEGLTVAPRFESQMTPPSRQPTNTEVKFSKKRLALAFAIAGISDAIGAFATPLPPIVWVVDFATALLLFLVLGRQWLLLPGLALEAIPGFGVLPFWLLVVGAIAALGTPRPTFQQR
jgi:hypothetical protein